MLQDDRLFPCLVGGADHELPLPAGEALGCRRDSRQLSRHLMARDGTGNQTVAGEIREWTQ
jgi:hypothetical protein